MKVHPNVQKNIKLMNMNDETITQNTILINSNHEDQRLKFILERMVTHLHSFARETRLTTSEWSKGIEFLTDVGKTCTALRQEFILLSDILGLSVLVDGLSNPKPPGATIGTLLGPFHTHDAEFVENGDSICSDGKGENFLIEGVLLDTSNNPIENATVSVWECDENGFYDTQYSDRDGPDMRGIIKTRSDGSYVIKCTKPVPYPIPYDGPVGKLLDKIGRHPFRPAHIHFIVEKPGYEKLVTALYLKGDPYENSDAVFGVKSDLLVSLDRLSDKDIIRKYNMKENDWYLNWNFKIVSQDEAKSLRFEKTRTAMKTMGLSSVELNADGLPIASDLD